MTIAVILNILAFSIHLGFIDFFSGFGNILNSTLTIMLAFIMSAYLFYANKKILMNFKDIDNEIVFEELEPFIEGSNHRNIHAAMMNVYFMYRRFFTAIVLIFLHGYPSLQVTALLLSALLNFIYTVIVQPYEENNIGEILNEFAILLCSYLMKTFL